MARLKNLNRKLKEKVARLKDALERKEAMLNSQAENHRKELER